MLWVYFRRLVVIVTDRSVSIPPRSQKTKNEVRWTDNNRSRSILVVLVGVSFCV